MNENIFKPYPILRTERLILRQIKTEDIDGIFKFNSDINSLKYIARDPYEKREQAEDRVKFFDEMYKTKKAVWWTFTTKEADDLIGYGGIFEIDKTNNRAEIGYGLLPEFWGNGFISEAMKAMVDFGLNKLQVHKLYAIVDPNNGASIKILEKNNFQREGILCEHLFARGKYFDMCYYGRINNAAQ